MAPLVAIGDPAFRPTGAGMAIGAREQPRSRRETVRRRLLPFTGLIGAVVMVPVLACNAYGLATAIWTAGFAVCDVIALTAAQPCAPVVLMLVTAVASRRLPRRSLAAARVPADAPAGPWS